MDTFVLILIFALGVVLGAGIAWFAFHRMEAAKMEMRDAVGALSAEALRNNAVAVDAMLKPLQDSLGQMQTHVYALETARSREYGALNQQLQNLFSAQDALKLQTTTLVQALKSSQVRGRWGEIQLRRVVELAGMLSFCDFCEQTAIGDTRLRPDLTVKLPGGRLIFVDSKAPLSAFLEALETQDDAIRKQKMRTHATQVRNHLRALGAKDYGGKERAAAEFVVCFVPGEAFLSTALEQDPTLLEYGVEQGVMLATPMTLISLLKAVAYGWTQEKLAENAARISEEGRLLHDRIGIFIQHMTRLGGSMQSSVKAYNEALSSFESRVMVSARKFEELGINTDKQLPELPPIDLQPRG